MELSGALGIKNEIRKYGSGVMIIPYDYSRL